MGDKIEAGMNKANGKAKEAAGKATGNDDMVAEGQAEQVEADTDTRTTDEIALDSKDGGVSL